MTGKELGWLVGNINEPVVVRSCATKSSEEPKLMITEADVLNVRIKDGKIQLTLGVARNTDEEWTP